MARITIEDCTERVTNRFSLVLMAGIRAKQLKRGARSLVKADLLVLDDWGPDRLNAGQRRDLMEIVEDRYGNGSTLITSQLPVEKWHDVIGEPTFADAILDRLVHNAYRLTLDGPSMRKVKGEQKEKAA